MPSAYGGDPAQNGCGACGGTRSRVGLSIQCRSGGGFAVSKQPHVAIVISTTADTPELALSADWRTALDPVGLAKVRKTPIRAFSRRLSKRNFERYISASGIVNMVISCS